MTLMEKNELPPPPKNELNKKYLGIVLILIIIGTGFFIIFVPFTHTVGGTIDKWVLYSNCFYLNINGQGYWLNYNGFMNGYAASAVQGDISYFNKIFNTIQGHWSCTLKYSSCLLFPQGNAPFYANNIQLDLIPSTS
jgi:hypothetical protein